MKIVSVKTARVVASVLIGALVIVFGAICFLPERTVYISGGVSYAPVYSGNQIKRQIALAVNVYEGADIVVKMVDKLNAYGFHATFFVGGCWADDNAETLKYVLSNGNELGNHGYFHLDHKKISEQKNNDEIVNCHKIVKAVTGVDMNLFAPPSGAFGELTLKVAQRLGYKTVLWSRDTIDWRDQDQKLIVKRATEKVKNGDIILMHPKAHTLGALDDILTFYKENGFTAVTVSQCIEDD
ncbi:MAG: polysaccharide deacetylase family protein [Clostridia bacterium]|nr:polysaccharide deacetylase family protein [Clostridia bacterium]